MNQEVDASLLALESVNLSENDGRLPSMNSIMKMIESIGRTTEEHLILRMHPETYKSWVPNIASARIGLHSDLQARLEYRCNDQHDEATLSISTRELDSDVYCIA